MASEKSERMRRHKLGPNRKEMAVKPKKLKSQYSESRDIREDRGVRHKKFATPKSPKT